MDKFTQVLARIDARRLSILDGAEILGVSERTLRRYRRRYEVEGLEGLFDRRLGSKSARAVPADEIAWMLDLYQSDYFGWTVKHFHDHLVKYHNYHWGYTFTKKRLQHAGLVTKALVRGKHRRKRARKPCIGMMLHQDGSTHEWLEDQGQMDLIVTMDDATSRVYSAFLVDEEGTNSTFQALLEVFGSFGLPSSFYTDRGSHYFVTAKAGEKVDRHNLTQVGRALYQLGVEHIAAYSPQARGRSERAFGTFQNRLVKELKLHGITTMEEANAYIGNIYVPDHNARFAVEAEDDQNAFVPVTPDQLHDTLCVQHSRIVNNDNTVSYRKFKLQLPQSPIRHHYVKANVRVHHYPDNTMAVFHGPRKIAQYCARGKLIETRKQPGVDCSNAGQAVDMRTKGLTPLDHIPTAKQNKQERTTHVL